MRREPNPISVQRGNQLALQICCVPEEKHQPPVSKALPVVSSFSIFNLLAVPPPDDTSFRCYGSSEVKILAAHYYSTQTHKEKLHAE